MRVATSPVSAAAQVSAAKVVAAPVAIAPVAPVGSAEPVATAPVGVAAPMATVPVAVAAQVAAAVIAAVQMVAAAQVVAAPEAEAAAAAPVVSASVASAGDSDEVVALGLPGPGEGRGRRSTRSLENVFSAPSRKTTTPEEPPDLADRRLSGASAAPDGRANLYVAETAMYNRAFMDMIEADRPGHLYGYPGDDKRDVPSRARKQRHEVVAPAAT